jgi:hypothetical protein
MIQIKSYSINSNQILTNEVLDSYITRFWNEVYASLISNNEEIHLMILCKVQYSDNEDTELGYKTLGPLRRVEFKDKDLFINYLTERLGILIESYNSQSVSKIVFTYVVKEGLISNDDRLLLQDLTNKELASHEFNKIKLPISMNPSDYGKVLGTTVFDKFTRFITTTNKRVFQIDVSLDNLINTVTILGSSDLSWIDTKISNDSFKREIGKSTIYFLDGEIILQKKELNAKSFRRLRKTKCFK